MKFFLFLVAFLFFAFGLLNIFIPSKGKRIFHALIYFIPFRIWGFIFLIIFFALWHFAFYVKFPIFIKIFSIVSFFSGFYLIFSPRRKIKKIIENWMNATEKRIRIIGFIFIFLGIYVSFLLL